MVLIKFTALNETNVQPTEQPVDPLDAPLRQCETLYNLALRRDHASAKELYVKLLRHDLMKNPMFQTPNNGIPLSQRITRLKYCVLKNYAELLEHEHQIHRTKMDAQNAIEYYHRALRIDQSDHGIWLRIGKLAMSEEINDPQYARSALTKALEDFNVAQSFSSFDGNDETRVSPVFLSPIHREALNELCRLLYDIGDFYACLRAIDKGLKVDPYNRTLNQLRIQLLENTWVRSLLPNDYYENSPPIIRPLFSEEIPRRLKPSGVFSSNAMVSLRFSLQNCTWNGLGEFLINIYDKIMSSKINVDDDSLVPVKSRHIVIELQGNVVKTPDTNDTNVPVQKRKRKEPPNDYNNDKTTPTRSSRVTSKITSKIDSFNQKRDEALSEFLEKIEPIIEKVEPDYLISIKQEDDAEIDKFLLYFSKIWNQHVSSEYHGTSIEEAINNPRPNTASDPRFYMFTPHTDPPLSSSYFLDNYRTQESFISFVNEMNNRNSGITDYLCMYIIHLFGKFVETEGEIKPLWICRWPDGLKEIVREILQRIDNQLLAMIENTCTDWDKSTNCAAVMMEESNDNIFQQMKQKSEVLMGICEFLFDSQISRNGSTTDTTPEDVQDTSNHQEMPSSLQITLDMCKWLIYRSSWNIMDFVSNAESQVPQSEDDVEKWKHHHKMWEDWSSQLNARYWWCTSRIEFWKGELDKAKTSFEECKRILGSNKCEDIVIVNCAFDAHISITIINNKIGSIESRKDLPADDWSRAITHFADAIKFLLNWVSDNIDEDRVVQFWTTIHSINEAISKVTEFMANGHSVAKLPANEYKKFKKYFRILYKTSFEILFPKTEEIVNAEAELSEPLHVLCARTWILFYHLLKEKHSDLDEDDFAEFLVTVHDQLGERYICGADNGSFLKFCIKTFTELHPSENRVYEYQCCHCLYRVVLSVDAENPWDHKTQPVELDIKTAELLFKNIRNYINEKQFRTWQIKNDVKDTLDKIANVVIPPRDRFDQCSWRTQHFLESEINFYEAIQYKEHDHCISDLGAVSYRDAGEDITDLYYFRGKILQYQFKTRTKANQTRAIETLEKAIEQFTYDLSINPLRFASWYALGACYASLADENLTWNAEEILNNRGRIAMYQRKSFLCFARAAKVITWFSGQQSPTVPTEEVSFWRDFGYQVYSMITEPMSLEAFQLNPYHAVLWRKPNFEDAYAFAAFCFGKAMQHERYLIENQNDKENGMPIIHDWRTPYMLGKCYQKLDKNPEVVIQLYKLAIDRTPEKSGVSGQEKILDAEYKLTSALSKYLMKSKIKPHIVEKYLSIDVENDDDVYKESQDKESPNEGSQTEESQTEEPTIKRLQNEELPTEEPQIEGPQNELGSFDIRKPEYRHAYDLICSKLEDIRKTDKNKWHHRPVFRHAWLTYKVERRPDVAMSILSPLFHLKLTSKTFMNVWKPEFERSGRHFIYVHEYISFYLELARETLDVDTLNKMSEKLRKASNIILKDEIIQTELANAHKHVKEMQEPVIDEEMTNQINDEEKEPDEQNNIKEHKEPSNNVMSVASLITQDNDSPMVIDFVEPTNNDYSEI